MDQTLKTIFSKQVNELSFYVHYAAYLKINPKANLHFQIISPDTEDFCHSILLLNYSSQVIGVQYIVAAENQ